MSNPDWSEVGPQHSMTKMMAGLVDGHYQLCAEAGMSPWDFCVVLANVQGIILGGSKDMPTDKALERIKSLGEIASLRVHEQRAPNEGKKSESKN